MYLSIILAIAFLNIVYLIGFFGLSIWLDVAETQYFLGYNPRLIRFRIRHVTFNIGFYVPIVALFPIYTMVDGKQRMKYPWEFSEHGLMKRLVTTFGGAIALVIAGVLISIGQFYFTTDSFISKEEINKVGIYPSELARESGFLPGDEIIAVNGKDYQKLDDLISPKVMVTPDVHYTVVRQGEKIELTVRGMAQDFMNTRKPFISLRVPYEIITVLPGSPADQAGLKPGDKITKVNEQLVASFEETLDVIRADDDGQITLQVKRKSNVSPEKLILNLSLGDKETIGIASRPLINYTIRRHSFGEALLKGPGMAFTRFSTNLRGFTRVIGGSLSPNSPNVTISGPISLQQASSSSLWWTITGLNAIWYAFWNLLPLPKSAFWEVIPMVYEGLTKKKYPYTAFKKSTRLSWIFFVVLSVWIFVIDIIKLF